MIRIVMIRALGVLCCLFMAAWCPGQVSPVLQKLLSSPGLENAAVSISVKRMDGSRVVEYNPRMALTPASVAKLIPTAWALKTKGKDYRYRTEVFYSGQIRDGILVGDIVVKAGGDPTPESRYFPESRLIAPVAEAAVKAGIRQIRGTVRVEGASEGTDIPGSWPWEDVSNYYAALYLPFNYRDNSYTLTFRSGEAGFPAELQSVVPEQPGIRFVNRVTASASGGDDAWIFGGPYSDVMCVAGTIPHNRTSFRVRGAMHRPAGAFVRELLDELRRRGVTAEDRDSEVLALTPLFSLVSPALEEIVFHTNKSSVNLFAEALGALCAPHDYESEAKRFLKEVGVESSGITLKDACGLSPVDALPAGVLTDLLLWAGKNLGTPFLHSLPLAGTDGGLNGYCSERISLKNRLSAKTGSMSGVRCLSGYLETLSGHRLAFTVMINHYSCTTVQLQRAVGNFLSGLQGG